MKTAVDLCLDHQIDLTPEGRALLRDSLSPQEFFERMLEKAHYADARRVLAHALPKRRALWWGCLCAWDAYRPQMPEGTAMALQSVLRFVIDPSEANRRATELAAEKVGMDTLAGCLAMGAFFSGGNVSQPHLPPVEPLPFVTGRLVSAAVYLASVTREPARYEEYLRQYLTLGQEVARGRHLWTTLVPAVASGEPIHWAGFGQLLQAPLPVPEPVAWAARTPVEEESLAGMTSAPDAAQGGQILVSSLGITHS